MSLRPVLLALLSKEPNTGYGLGRLLRSELSHLWDARLQQIYAELAQLQAEGLVEVQSIDLPNRPAKKLYSLMQSGQRALDEWLVQPPAALSYRDDLLVRLYCLDRMPSDVLARRLEQRYDERSSASASLYQRLAQTPRTDPAQLGRLLTLEAALARTEAEAAWCERALSTVRGARAAPAEAQEAAGA